MPFIHSAFLLCSFRSHILLQNCFVSLSSGCIHPVIAGWIFFRCFEMFNFVRVVWFCLDIFLVFLLSPIPSGLFPRVVLFVSLVFLFSFRPSMLLHLSSVLSFLLVVVGFLSAFPVEFLIQVLSFCSCFLSGNTDVFSDYFRLVHLIPLCCSLRNVSIIRLFIPFLPWLYFQSWFFSDGNLVLFSDIILLNFSLFISSFCVNVCSVWFVCGVSIVISLRFIWVRVFLFFRTWCVDYYIIIIIIIIMPCCLDSLFIFWCISNISKSENQPFLSF